MVFTTTTSDFTPLPLFSSSYTHLTTTVSTMSRPPTQEEMYAAWLQQQQQRQQQQQQPMAAQQQPQTPFTTPAPQQQQYQIYGQPQIQDPYFQGLAQPGLALRLIQSPAMAQLRQQLYDESMQQAQFIYQTVSPALECTCSSSSDAKIDQAGD